MAVVIKGVDGSQRIVMVSELLNDGKEYSEDECCVYGNCSCSSLDHALANLTSNVLINITNDVTLSSLVTVSDLENVSIIGHNNPTVNCRSVGGIQFTFSHHIIIQGITWVGCGTENPENLTESGLKLSNSSNVLIKKCTFQQSIGQAIVLSEMSGDVNINDCKFVNNSYYRGHGAAIHYSSNDTRNSSQVVFTISIHDCNFSYNKFKIKSLVYFKNVLFKYNKIIFGNSVFDNNQGTSIHAINHNIFLNGEVLLLNNTADNGAGIYISDHSTVMFGENSDVKFIQNLAKYKGGAIILRNLSSIIFDQNCIATFINNSASIGTVYSDTGSNVTFRGNCHVTFSGNIATQSGAAIYSDSSLITFTENSNVIFSHNYLPKIDIPVHNIYIYDHHSGIIYSVNFNRISFEGNSTTVFHNNNADDGGGIYSSNHGCVSFKGNSKTTFNNNSVAYEGGAIYQRRYGSVLFKENATVEFSNNNAVDYGGAIESYMDVNISFGGYSIVTFTDNSANYGGSIDSYNSGRIFFEENSTASFNDNTADRGGAIYSVYYTSVSFAGNSSTEFISNTADHGGAIYSDKTSEISLNRNSIAVFRNNMADYGGAIKSGSVSFNGNSATVFSDNIANNNGGAMRLIDAKLTFDDFSIVNFTNNKATIGTTIYSTGTSRIVEIGHPTVIFNSHIVNWCNTTCSSGDHNNSDGNVDIKVDSNGTISCKGEQQAFKLLSRKCGFIYLEDVIANLTSNELVNISDMVISSVVYLTRLHNISIIGNKVKCVNNAGLLVDQCSNITIEGVNWVGCGADTTPVISILNSSDVTLKNCLFQRSLGPAVMLLKLSGDVNIDHCQFMNNSYYRGHGAAIHYSSNHTTNSQPTLIISNCNFSYNKDTIFSYNEGAIFSYNEGAIFSYNEGATSLLYLNGQTEDTNISLCNSSFHNNHGISIYLSSNTTLHVSGNVLFEKNVAENGAGIHANDFSKVIFNKNSSVKFNNNSAYRNGAAISLNDHSGVLFDQNTVVTFSSNSATQYGSAIYSCNNSHVTFTGNSNVNFIKNIHGKFTYWYFFDGPGTVYSEHHSSVSFEENSTVAFHENIGYNGGAIVSHYNSIIIFQDNSTVLFNNNEAHNFGGAIFSNNGTVTIKGNSSVTFNNNTAGNGGAVYCENLHSDTFFDGNSIITFSSNGSNETTYGRVMYYSIISISGFAIVTLTNNTAHGNGGAVYCEHNQIFLLGGNSIVTFSGNKAIDGGAIHVFSMCKIIFKENSNSTFSNNLATNNGGTILSREYSDISFMGTSEAVFNNNAADNGGIFYLDNSITLTFNDSAVITFTNNNARQRGGVFYFLGSFVLFNGNSIISFAYNEAMLDGGAMYCHGNSNISFSGFTNVSFNDNKAIDGGVLFAYNNSKILFKEYASVAFIKNEARGNGGVGYFNSLCSITLQQNCNVTFENNNAILGGALCINSNTNITFTDNSTSLLKYNKAIENGGAINIQTNSNIMVNANATITFIANNAQYGGAIFFGATNTTLQFSNDRDISFVSNTAEIAGAYMYFDSTESSGSCFNRIIGIKSKIQHFIATPPNKLVFYDPAICIDYDNKAEECNTYYLQNIMLGEEINVLVCVSNYCNQPSYSTQFTLHGENNQTYSMSGSNQILLSCNETFQGISIIGNKSIISKSLKFNYTINIALHDHRNSWKQVFVNLSVELTPCHPGFWQYPESEKCECYNANDIVFCSGSGSTIKRGYWFGKVAEQPTVTICPINYCDFTCCEASNGYYHLSPLRDNQCRSHRSGTACGSCTDGYTLSFDSTECVDVDSCTAGQTVLVILLTVTYWIVMVTLVFAMMYYKVGIGYLYSITYYYSIVDILLSENLHASRGLYLTVSIISSFSKITPQFLGELCLTTGMSGIDQYFIHFVHPSAVLLILIIISLSARSSRRISAFISRGIIHVICLLLLLSYTSIASTSLLLMRPLIFHGIDIPYTYLSPDIEYFHGRHLAYGIVSLICIITIVVGLPLLLTFEPFLNHKFNFAKIKPLLDQFQGCYKDKCRCFAGYYMICRLVIITIIIADAFNNMVTNYLLITVSAIIALIQLLAKPYNNEILNKLDGVILHIMILITALPLFDDLDSPSVITIIAFVLLFLPLLIIIVMTLYLHKDDLQKFAMRVTLKKRSPHRNVCSKNEIPMVDYQFIRDSSTRESVTVTLLDM